MSRFLRCLLFLAVFAGSVQAELIIYDGFDYPAGSLGGNEGGSGWDPGSAWSGGQNVASPGLEYPYLPTVGNTAVAADDASYRSMPAGFDALNNTTWIGFLCQDLETPDWCGVSTYNDGDESLFIGKPGGTNNWGIHMYNVLGDADAKTGAEASQTSISELVFFVVRIVNGSADARITAWINPDLNSEPSNETAFYDSEAFGHKAARVPFNRIRIDGPGEAMFFDELRIGETYADVAGTSNQENATSPSPRNEEIDVPQDLVLTWDPGDFAVTHDVYFGETFQDVDSATQPTHGSLDVNAVALDRLEFGKTYYWRVDEVNGAPDNFVYTGPVWSFEVEPYSRLVPGEMLTVTASSSSNELSIPERTVDGSGFGDDNTHSMRAEDMWFSGNPDLAPWIQYEFDEIKKLDIMKVWNSNSAAEMAIGWGVKDVQIEYSVDGEIWTVLEGANQLSRASGSTSYDQYDEIDFAGAAAKYVRLNIQSNWG
ncbi:MAG: discoidin domain-containing protein, partial [Planctomycetes bacterium]|nr:discoidin domain-containing protein [Planctomycetota bacterium]